MYHGLSVCNGLDLYNMQEPVDGFLNTKGSVLSPADRPAISLFRRCPELEEIYEHFSASQGQFDLRAFLIFMRETQKVCIAHLQ